MHESVRRDVLSPGHVAGARGRLLLVAVFFVIIAGVLIFLLLMIALFDCAHTLLTPTMLLCSVTRRS